MFKDKRVCKLVTETLLRIVNKSCPDMLSEASELIKEHFNTDVTFVKMRGKQNTVGYTTVRNIDRLCHLQKQILKIKYLDKHLQPHDFIENRAYTRYIPLELGDVIGCCVLESDEQISHRLVNCTDIWFLYAIISKFYCLEQEVHTASITDRLTSLRNREGLLIALSEYAKKEQVTLCIAEIRIVNATELVAAQGRVFLDNLMINVTNVLLRTHKKQIYRTRDTKFTLLCLDDVENTHLHLQNILMNLNELQELVQWQIVFTTFSKDFHYALYIVESSSGEGNTDEVVYIPLMGCTQQNERAFHKAESTFTPSFYRESQVYCMTEKRKTEQTTHDTSPEVDDIVYQDVTEESVPGAKENQEDDGDEITFNNMSDVLDHIVNEDESETMETEEDACTGGAYEFS